jgi:hypothetical protein
MHLLNTIALVSIVIGVVSSIVILIDILGGRKQSMAIMNYVWPITGLYAGPLALLAYFKLGRAPKKSNHHQMQMHHPQKPFWQSVVLGALHCGSGCTIGDLVSEIFLLLVPVTVFGSVLAGRWTIDYVFAFVIGIIFQYYAVKPMKKLSGGEALKAALKADALSLTSWQIGMYGWMAISIFLIFNHSLEPDHLLFWFMMQIAMLLGFCTAYPVNWWLIKKGIKEAM